MKRSDAHTGFRFRALLLLLASSLACFGQRQNEPRPAPLDPFQAEQEARALVATMLAQKPDQNATNTGSVKIRDAAGNTREIPVRFEISSTPTNWVSVYETLPSAIQPGGLKLTVIHAGEQPNCYTLLDPATASTTNAAARRLTPDQIMTPFAGSDFWIADLGLEFLHWPKQRLLRKEMRHSKSCNVLESLNPAPVPGGYSRVVSWIMIESPHGIVHADAYDAQGQVLKRFDPKNLEKIQGEYQLEEMEIRNRKTDSQTVIKFNLADSAPTGAPD
jgi:YD repeat-containing protein